MGEQWALDHVIGTGPFVQGECIQGDRCTLHAVKNHWRKTPEISSITGLEIQDTDVLLAAMKSGRVDTGEVNFQNLEQFESEGFRFIDTMNGGYVGQSILWSGNLWEHTHVRTGDPLEPWNSPVYEVDYPWIGNPWGHQGEPCSNGDGPGHDLCGDAPYNDTDNPAGMDDMEQARLVRLGLSVAIPREGINQFALKGLGLPLYSEYMGPGYPGWEPNAESGCFDWIGSSIDCGGTRKSIRWQHADGDLALADELLTLAGYPLVDGRRGPVAQEVAQIVIGEWASLGIEMVGSEESYGDVISPRMRNREQVWPILKNGDVHSNQFPLDWALPAADTSSTRPGWGVGFESQPAARWLFEIYSERDAALRTAAHINWINYSIFWQQYAGVFQVPKGIVVNSRIKSWIGHPKHYASVSGDPEFIELN
jgi:ABC-type transport system substrate-binding protein